MQNMLKRWIAGSLKKNISRNPAVVLLGARQVGKTTLAKTIKDDIGAVYLDLENVDDLALLNEPRRFLSSQGGKLVILDEIQRKPDLFMVLRGLIDENRQQGREGAQFLLLGSASMKLLRQSESLAGRIAYTNMTGLNVLEIDREERNIRNVWLRGGFPRSYLAQNDTAAMEWNESLVRTYLERDVPEMGFDVPSNRLRRLWTWLAHCQGSPVNASEMAASLEISHKNVNLYIDILAGLLLIRRLEPWRTNVKKRIRKTPRYYVRDSGILHRLLGIRDYNALLSGTILGKSWEGFVIENIHSILSPLTETYFYRTAAGAEIDLLVKMPNAEMWAIEIKSSVSPNLNPHYSKICDEVKAARKYVVYGGNDKFPAKGGVTVISLPKIMEELISAQS